MPSRHSSRGARASRNYRTPPNTADALDLWAVDERHPLAPADYYVDANNAGEGLIVAYWLR